eukprot:8953612-Pyramimonas_sp.AAC.1
MRFIPIEGRDGYGTEARWFVRGFSSPCQRYGDLAFRLVRRANIPARTASDWSSGEGIALTSSLRRPARSDR